MIHVMAWHQTGDKPLSAPMMAVFTDANKRHSAQMIKQTIMW